MIHKAFNEDDFRQDKKENKSQNFSRIVKYYLAAVSLLVLGLGIYLWFGIVGFDGPDILALYKLNNFDAILRVGLAILLPALGVGLWLNMRWALILWGLITASLTGFYIVMKAPGYVAELCLFSVGSLFILYVLVVFSFYLYEWHQAKEKN